MIFFPSPRTSFAIHRDADDRVLDCGLYFNRVYPSRVEAPFDVMNPHDMRVLGSMNDVHVSPIGLTLDVG
jgi:hypothetical protein